MSTWSESTPALASGTGQDKADHHTRDPLERDYRRALAALDRWDGSIDLPAHPLLQRQRDRANLMAIRAHPDLALSILPALPVRLDDRDVLDAWRHCGHWTPRVLLGLDAQRWPPMGWSAIFTRELVATFTREGAAWQG